MTVHHLHPQLSFHVEPHPASARDDDSEPYLIGSLKLTGSLAIRQDLQSGDELTIQVCDKDGTVIASGTAEAKPPAFKDIKNSGVVIGTERVTTAKIEIQ